MTNDSPLRLIRKHVFKASQDGMAAVAGVDRAQISRYETGKADPTLSVLRQIRNGALAQGLPFSSEYFFDSAAVLAANRVPDDVQ